VEAYLGLVDDSELEFDGMRNVWLIYGRTLAKEVLKKIGRMGFHSGWENDVRYARLDTFTRHLFSQTHEIVLPTLLRNYDRYSMMNGVEIRMPFLDHRIVTFLLSLDWRSKIRNGMTKAILRDAMKPYLPKEVYERKTKIGFGAPISHWIKGPMKSYLLDHLESRSFRECSLIEPVEVRRKLADVMEAEKPSFVMGESAWRAIQPYLWEQAVIKKRHV
jgi:asparagine synthase (glutamine-hydrolysing)